MIAHKPYKTQLILLLITLLLFFMVNISLGSVTIPLLETIKSLIGLTLNNETWQFIITQYRLPKAITAVIVGASLSIAGLLMQTMFKNPLAGPFVLGLSSGASLGVALLILGSSFIGGVLGNCLLHPGSLVVAAALGSFLVLLVVVALTLKIKDTMTILIIGLMFGSLSSALVAVLSYFSSAQKLQQFVFWSFGSLGNVSWYGLLILSISFSIGLWLSLKVSKNLNTLLLGENYAQSLGVNVKRNNLLIIIATSLLAGSATAFAGPIAFVGLAVPHLTRLVFKTANHLLLLPAVMCVGAILMLVCDIIAQVPFTDYALPINAVTSLIGAPVVIWLLVRKKKLMF